MSKGENNNNIILTATAFGGLIILALSGWGMLLMTLLIGGLYGLHVYLQGGQCSSPGRLDGKTVIITGGNSGIGKETARLLGLRGARVILGCRDMAKAKAAASDIKSSIGTGADITTEELDLASFSSVRKFAEKILATEENVHILINNAGVMMCPFSLTEDGNELQMQTNHHGHFLLTNLLLPKIQSSTPARIINVSSNAHQWTKEMNLDNNTSEENYSRRDAYGQSKLANILFTQELASKLQGTGVTTYSLHPGVINTELGRHLEKVFPSFITALLKVMLCFAKTPLSGAQTTVYCAVDKELANESGKYYSDCKQHRTNKNAEDVNAQKLLWEKSLKVVGLSGDGIIENIGSNLQMNVPPPVPLHSDEIANMPLPPTPKDQSPVDEDLPEIKNYSEKFNEPVKEELSDHSNYERKLQESSIEQKEKPETQIIEPNEVFKSIDQQSNEPLVESVESEEKQTSEPYRKSPDPFRDESLQFVEKESSETVHLETKEFVNQSSEPIRQRSEEPVQQESPEPVLHESPEPVRQESPEPVRQESPEPVRQESPEPVRQESLEPVRQESLEPVRQKSPEAEPITEVSPELSRKESPEHEPMQQESPKFSQEKLTEYAGPESPELLKTQSSEPPRQESQTKNLTPEPVNQELSNKEFIQLEKNEYAESSEELEKSENRQSSPDNYEQFDKSQLPSNEELVKSQSPEHFEPECPDFLGDMKQHPETTTHEIETAQMLEKPIENSQNVPLLSTSDILASINQLSDDDDDVEDPDDHDIMIEQHKNILNEEISNFNPTDQFYLTKDEDDLSDLNKSATSMTTESKQIFDNILDNVHDFEKETQLKPVETIEPMSGEEIARNEYTRSNTIESVASFDRSSLTPSLTEEKNILPSCSDIAEEKKAEELLEGISSFDTSELKSVDKIKEPISPQDLMKTEIAHSQVLQNVEEFHKEDLKPVVTEEKNVLPNVQDIQGERIHRELLVGIENFDPTEQLSKEVETREPQNPVDLAKQELLRDDILDKVSTFDKAELKETVPREPQNPAQLMSQEIIRHDVLSDLTDYNKDALTPTKTREPMSGSELLQKELLLHDLKSDVTNFEKSALTPTKIEEKIVLPDAATIEAEKSLMASSTHQDLDDLSPVSKNIEDDDDDSSNSESSSTEEGIFGGESKEVDVDDDHLQKNSGESKVEVKGTAETTSTSSSDEWIKVEQEPKLDKE